MSGGGGLAREVLIDYFPNHALDLFGKFGWACFFASGMAAIWKEHRGRLLAESSAAEQIAVLQGRLQEERAKKDGPQVFFEYSVSRKADRKIQQILDERIVSIRNSGPTDALNVQFTKIQNGAYSAMLNEIPILKPKQELLVQVNVEHGSYGTVMGGLLTLLDAERAADVQSIEDAFKKRRFRVSVTYRDIHKRQYQTDFDIEYTYLFSAAQTFLVDHRLLPSENEHSH